MSPLVLKRSLTLLILLCLFFNVSAQTNSSCDFVEVIDLRGVLGYAQPDELVVCAAPDTLAIIVFTDAEEPLLGVELELQLPSGMQYGGFVYSDNGGTANLLNGVDPKNPKFLLGTLDQSMPNVVYIGVTADCNYTYNPESQYISMDIEYFDPDNFPCQQSFDLSENFDAAIKVPVLNTLSLNPAEITVTTSETEFCHTLLISQDGINAYVDSFTFEIQGIELQAELEFSLYANGIPVTGYDYNPTTDILLANIEGMHFLGNNNLACPTCPADEQFDENEQVEIDICFEMVTCPINSEYVLMYNVYHECYNQACLFDDPLTTRVKIQPNFGAAARFNVTRIQEPSFCGDEAIFDFWVTSNKTDSLAGLFQDLQFYLETCDSRRFDYTEVSIGGTVLPDQYWSENNPSVYQLNFYLDALNFDPDGPDGLDDIDEDGIYNDLAGGDTIRGQFKMAVQCDATGCFELTCDMNWGAIRSGKKHCGNQFSQGATGYSPTIQTRMRETARFTNDTMQPSINYSKSYIVTDDVYEGTQTPFLVEHGYAYEQVGFQTCSESGGASRTFLKILITGQTQEMVQDVEFKPGSASWNGMPVPDADVSYSYDAATGTATFIIDAGDEDVTALTSYLYELQVDECHAPSRWLYINSFVIQECVCPDGTVCQTIKSCEYIPVWVWYRGCGYCELSHYGTFNRKSTGYTDESLTTKVSLDEVNPDDTYRFMPCDTVRVCINALARQENLEYDSLKYFFVHYVLNPNTGRWNFGEWENAAAFDILENTMEFNYYDASTASYINPVCTPLFEQEWWQGYVYPPQHTYHYNITDFTPCLSELPDDIDLGDSLLIHYDMVVFHNPNRDDECGGWNGVNLSPPDADATPSTPVEVRFLSSFRAVRKNDPSYGIAGSSGVACNNVWQRYQFDCPEITSYNNYYFDECTDTVEHVFKASVGPEDENWYEDEFRPIYELSDLYSNIPEGSFIKQNSPKVIYPEGEEPLMIDSLIDFTCQTVMATEYCFETPGGNATVYFDGENLRNLSVGQGNNDSIVIQYCVGTLCPASPNTADLYLNWRYDYLTCGPEYGETGANETTTFINKEVNHQGTPSNLISDIDRFVIGPVGDTQFNTYEVCSNGGTQSHYNLGTQITLPDNIELVSIKDPITGNPYPFTIINVTDTTETFLFEGPLELGENECWEVEIETRFLYCISGRDNVSVELYTFSSCLPASTRGALLTGDDETCADARDFYIYELEPSGIQLDFEQQPPNAGELCEIYPVSILYKNVKKGANYEQEFGFWFPNQGFEIVPGSFRINYPGGPNVLGPSTMVPDPSPDPSYSPALGAYHSIGIEDMDAWLALNGLPGVNAMSGATDSNKVLITFDVTTSCDNFVSGSVIRTEVKSVDNCQRPLESSINASNPFIVEGADPNFFPKFLMFSGVDQLYCGETTLNVGGINLSNAGVTDGNSEIRITLPPGVNYIGNSFEYQTPSGYMPPFVNDSMAGGATYISSKIPPGLGLNDVFSINMDILLDEGVLCDTLVFEALVTSQVDDLECESTGELCPVLVQSTLNPLVNIVITPQLTVNDAEMILSCSDDPALSNLEYVLDSENLGGDLINQPITVNIYNDFDEDGMVTPGLDNLLSSDSQFITVPEGESTEVRGEVQISSDVSCPLVVEYVFDGVCECNEMQFPIEDVRIKSTDNIDGPIGVCRGNEVAIAMCPSFDFSFMPMVNPADYYVLGDSLYFTLSDMQTAPVYLKIEANLGDCEFEETIIITDATAVGLNAGEDQEICATECTSLVASLESGGNGNASYFWYPSNGLSDPNTYNPEFCPPNDAAGLYRFMVDATLPDGCLKRDTVDINVLASPVITAIPDTNVYCLGDSVRITISPDIYNTYVLYYQDPISGLDIPVDSGPDPYLYVYQNPGVYYVQAIPNNPEDCPGVSEPFEIGEQIPACNNPGIEPNIFECDEDE